MVMMTPSNAISSGEWRGSRWFFRHPDLPHYEALPSGEGPHHVDRLFRALRFAGAARGLANDGDDFRLRLGQRRDPIDKTTLNAGASSVAKILPK
jgi:hypothetical protein